MKKIISTLLSLALVIGIFPIFASAEATLSGTGVEGDPYIISNAAELKAARDMINADTAKNGASVAWYKLTADIDLENEEWTPIGVYAAVPFSGHFDGGEHVVKNIWIEIADGDDYDATYRVSPFLGFFGRVNVAGSSVSNLGVENVTIINNAPWYSTSKERKIAGMGGFAGGANTEVKFTNCYAKNVNLVHNVTSTPAGVGGFVGSFGGNQTPTFTNCYVYGATIASACTANNENVGGFAGGKGADSTKVTYTNCYVADAKVTATTAKRSSVYGFATTGGKLTTATNCYSELDDIITYYDNSGTPATKYDANRTLGTVGATKETIVEAMKKVGYATDASINDGYPCFAWEIPEVEPWDGVAAESFAEGSGTAEDPYKIYTAAELKLASDTVNNSKGTTDYYWFSLENDIDYENNHWTPIGHSDTLSWHAFRGGFDGNGHVVKNLSIEGYYNYYCCGFFGWVSEATITDLGIDNLQIKVTNTRGVADVTGDEYVCFHIAGFAAKASEGTTITGCYIKNSSVQQTAAYPTGAQNAYTVSGFVNAIDVRDSHHPETVDTVTISDCYVQNVYLKTKNQGFACGFFGSIESTTEANAVSGHIFTNCYADVTVPNTISAHAFGYTGANSLATANSKVTAVDCYSTLTSFEGSNDHKQPLNTDAGFGTGGQSVTQIADVFANLEGWQDGENINDGFPALAWEPVEVIAPYVVNTVSLAKGTVTITVNDADTTGDQVCVAAYDSNGRLISAEFKPVATTVTTTVPANGAATVKVFIWNNNNPVIDAIVKDIY